MSSTNSNSYGVGHAFRARIPADWASELGTQFRGRVVYLRNFNRPTRLDQGQRVWLVIENVDFSATVALNAQTIGRLQWGSALRVEIQSWLQNANQIRVEVELPATIDRGDRNSLAGGLIGDVRLEIEES